MSAHQRRKGRAGELEVQKRLQAIGFPATILYGQEETGRDYGDIAAPPLGYVEVKRRGKLAKELIPPPSVICTYARGDRGEWMVVLRAHYAERLFQLERDYNSRK